MSGKTLTRTEMIERLSSHLHLTQSQASELNESIVQHIFQALNKSSQLKISSFGTFLVHSKAERVGRNPKTGVEAVISKRKSISFRASPLLKDKINRSVAR